MIQAMGRRTEVTSARRTEAHLSESAMERRAFACRRNMMRQPDICGRQNDASCPLFANPWICWFSGPKESKLETDRELLSCSQYRVSLLGFLGDLGIITGF